MNAVKKQKNHVVLSERDKKKFLSFVFRLCLERVVNLNVWSLVEGCLLDDLFPSNSPKNKIDSNEIRKVFLGTEFEMPVYGEDGYSQYGRDRDGYDRKGFDEEGRDRDGFGRDGFNEEGFDRKGYNKAGFNRKGFNEEGYDKDGYGEDGFNEGGRDCEGFDREGFNEEGRDRDGFDRDGFNEEGFKAVEDCYGQSLIHRNGHTDADKSIYGLDEEGYQSNGFNLYGFNKEGRDINGHTKEDHVNGIGCDAVLSISEKEKTERLLMKPPLGLKQRY